jgi:hypothetical protein
MNRTNSLRSSFARTALGIAVVLLAAASAVAETRASTTLGSQGEVYSVVAGTYGSLFPKGTALRADRPVLALDIARPDRSRQRILVRGTERPEVDAAPTLFLERSSNALYVVWESRRSATSSALLLTSFKGGQWSEPIEISDDLAPLKGAPQIAITRDGFTTRVSEDETRRHDTTVLHLAWWEKQADGIEKVYYAPVILENGIYVGWNPIYCLNDLDLAEGTDAAIPETLLQAPQLSPGKDVHSVVIGLVNGRTGRVLGIEVRPVPGEVGFLVDGFHSQLIDIGRRDDDRIKAAIQGFHSQLIDIGARFNKGVVRALASEMTTELTAVLNETPVDRPFVDLLDDFRNTIIRLGSDTLGDLNRSDRASLTLEIDRREADVEGDPENTHLIGLRLVSDRPAPPVGAGKARIYISEDAQRVLVSWRDGDTLVYSEAGESDGLSPAWAPTQSLPLVGLTEAEAEGMLESRVRQRH